MTVNKELEWKASDLEWDGGFISDTWIDGHWAVWVLIECFCYIGKRPPGQKNSSAKPRRLITSPETMIASK